MKNINGRRINQLIRKSDIQSGLCPWNEAISEKRTNCSIQLLKFRRNSMNAFDRIFYVFTREWKEARENMFKNGPATLCQIFRPVTGCITWRVLRSRTFSRWYTTSGNWPCTPEKETILSRTIRGQFRVNLSSRDGYY